MAARRTVLAAVLICSLPGAGVALELKAARRVELDARLLLREVFETERDTTHERTLEELRLRAAGVLNDWLRFEWSAVASSGGPTLKATRSGIYDWNDVFQDVSPAIDFDEAYFDVRLSSADLRLGKQKVEWGKLDRIAPNDLINPLSFHDPLLVDEAERKIAVPAIAGSYYLPEGNAIAAESRLTVVWVPHYFPYRLSTASCAVEQGRSHCDVERWFPPAGLPPTTFAIPGGAIQLPDGAANPPLSVPLSFRVDNGAPPAWRLENSEVGLRFSALVHDADVAVYYFHGLDPQPAFQLTAEAVGPPPDFGNLQHSDLGGQTTLSPVFRHIDSFGGDLTYAFDRAVVRTEAAFVRGRPLSRDLRLLIRDPASLADEIAKALATLETGVGRAAVQLPPAFAVRDVVEWGIGADYTYRGYVALLQLNQTDVLNNGLPLLIKDIDTRLLLKIRKSFLADRLHVQAVALYALESDYSILRPRLSYDLNDHMAAEVGYLFIAGRAHSLGGQYKNNDEGFVRLEYRL